jgi:ABC-type bacteriocin/lantibiotic exporter with double-glycine peptidase domain
MELAIISIVWIAVIAVVVLFLVWIAVGRLIRRRVDEELK